MKRKIKIGFLTTTDPNDRRSWSGIHYFLFETLKSRFGEVIPLGPLEDGVAKTIGRGKSFLLQNTIGKRFDYSHSSALSKNYAKQVEEKLKKQRPDILFAPTASTIVANLNTKIPIISLSDATMAVMLDYYTGYTNLTSTSKKQALEIEQKSIDKSTICIYPSDWAANSAINDFNANPSKIKRIPLGANMHLLPNLEDIDFNKSLSKLNFLFLGVEWERKGGPLVIETLNLLHHKGINVSLTICGCTPNLKTPFEINIIPFINKNEPEGEKKIGELFKQSHFLFLPSKAECYGIVFCEASAYGVPSLTFNTGGIGGAVEDHINGFKALDFKPDEFISYIENCIHSPEKYHQLCRTSRQRFEEKLNWNKFGDELEKLIDSIIPQ